MDKRRAFSIKEKQAILSKSNGRCAICGLGLNEETMTVEHIYPISQGGENCAENIVALCTSCNSKKSDSFISVTYYKCLSIEWMNRASMYVAQADMSLKAFYKTIEGISPYISINMGQSFMGNRHKNRNKSAMVLPRLKLELAYEKDSEDIVKFCESQNKYRMSNYTRFDNMYKVSNIIRYGKIYLIKTKSDSLVGILALLERRYLNVKGFESSKISLNGVSGNNPIIVAYDIKAKYDDSSSDVFGALLQLYGKMKMPFLAVPDVGNFGCTQLDCTLLRYCVFDFIQDKVYFETMNGQDEGVLYIIQNTARFYDTLIEKMKDNEKIKNIIR